MTTAEHRAVPLAYAIALALPLALTACGAGERAATPVVRDSAGITIVENAAPVWPEDGGWRVAAEPDVDIGVFEGEEAYQLYRVEDATRLSDGTIVVANRGTNELRYYDVDGRYLTSAGREGGGPGEFRFLSELYPWPGDTVVVGDGGQRRLSWFDAQGRFLRSVEVATPAGILANGTLIHQQSVPLEGRPQNGYSRRPAYLVHTAVDGEVLDTLGQVPGTEIYLYVRSSSDDVVEVSLTWTPFGRRQYVAVAEDRVYAGAGDRYEIEVYRPGRGLARLIRRLTPNPPVDDAAIERLRQHRLAGVDDAEARRRIEQSLADVDFPETMPAYGPLQVDALGNLWVEMYHEYRDPQENSSWSVFDPEGRWLGVVETPAGLEIQEIGADYILGVWRDELDVEHVRLYGLLKPGKE